MGTETANLDKVGKNGSRRKELPWQFDQSYSQLHLPLVGNAPAPSSSPAMKNFVARLFRTYVQWSPLPLRTVWLAAWLLSLVFVFTSFIGRTQLGTMPDRFDWWQQAPGPFLNFFTWALLLPLVNHWSQRWSLKHRPISPVIATHIGLGLVLCTLHEVATSAFYLCMLKAVGKGQLDAPTLHGMLLFLPAGIVQRFLEYWLLLLLLLLVESHRLVQEERNHVLRLQNELQTSQLLSLKKQLQPHFLFNTLNTVSALVDVDSRSARTVLARLGKLLRTTLDEERQEQVSLHHEIEHVGNYLGIEAIRFKDRLVVQYDISPECGEALVPGMVLQPLVENSIKHGLDTTSAEVRITISARREKDVLLLQVSDDGKGCANVPGALANGGIGLRNTMERLSLLHGEEGRFHAASGIGRGFHISIRIPFRTTDAQSA